MNKTCKKCGVEKSIHKFRYLLDGKDYGVAIIDRYDEVCGACRALRTQTIVRVAKELKKEKKQRQKVYVYGMLI
jgi:tRNA(Ile)-lysidine synthase TilS/MesJ